MIDVPGLSIGFVALLPGLFRAFGILPPRLRWRATGCISGAPSVYHRAIDFAGVHASLGQGTTFLYCRMKPDRIYYRCSQRFHEKTHECRCRCMCMYVSMYLYIYILYAICRVIVMGHMRYFIYRSLRFGRGLSKKDHMKKSARQQQMSHDL